MSRKSLENRIEDIESKQKQDNGVTIVPVDKQGEPREIDSLDNAESANLIVTIAVSDETYATWS
jgi:hypothetical protein